MNDPTVKMLIWDLDNLFSCPCSLLCCGCFINS